MKTPVRYILIDDSPINNFLCSMVIEQTGGESEIKAFEEPEKGFEYIIQEYSTQASPTILLLDINMPSWSGWEFLENFDKLDDKIKTQFKIYMLSSSISPCDRQRAKENKNVEDYIEKPLSEKNVLSMLEKQKEMA